MTATESLSDDDFDRAADIEIDTALSLEKPQSFFLYAGAGSGKTGSLKKALESVQARYGEIFRRQGRQVGVITYTNAARDEILRRVNFDTLFHVATIHSFAWTLLESRTEDIRGWLRVRLPKEIADIKEEQKRGRAGKASDDRARKIESKTRRLANLPQIRKFTYNPNGDNFGRDSLSHAEVIDIASEFINQKQALQKIILSRYPFLLIDESQDTLTQFIDALLVFEKQHHDRFALGLFGDTMQRIYTHGKENLANSIDPRWITPQKIMNHRSRERIVTLANGIRAEADGWRQKARSDKKGGYAFAYVLPVDTENKPEVENRIRADLSTRTADIAWRDLPSVKVLTLEHHMAAFRLGFLEFFDALDKVASYRTSFRDGTLPSVRLFTERILPLLDANQDEDRFGVMNLLRAHSPLVSKETLHKARLSAQDTLSKARIAVSKIVDLFADDNNPTLGSVLGAVQQTRIFPIPEALLPFSSPEFLANLPGHSVSDDEVTAAWAAALQAPFSQIRLYRNYTNDLASFGTHQGVKGLQFARVMVIIDDASSRFRATASYEKLLDAKPLSKTDKEHLAKGEETQLEKTRRLLYVTCTRAEESLALVIYTESPDAVAKKLVDSKWFDKQEIIKNV